MPTGETSIVGKQGNNPDVSVEVQRSAPKKGGWRALRPWQRSACILSLVIGLAGAVLMGVAWTTAPDSAPPPSPTSTSPLQPDSLIPTDPGEQTQPPVPESDRALDRWSPTLFRMGFGFFVGFAIAFALRSFVKISLVAIGLGLLLLLFLQWQGLIDVDWEQAGEHWDTFTAWASEQTRSFTAFVSGYFPSAAASLGGFVVGFRRA